MVTSGNTKISSALPQGKASTSKGRHLDTRAGVRELTGPGDPRADPRHARSPNARPGPARTCLLTSGTCPRSVRSTSRADSIVSNPMTATDTISIVACPILEKILLAVRNMLDMACSTLSLEISTRRHEAPAAHLDRLEKRLAWARSSHWHLT